MTCEEVENGGDGTCKQCGTAEGGNEGKCVTCNNEELYKPDENGVCKKTLTCEEVENGGDGTCKQCGTAEGGNEGKCVTCNNEELYKPDENGVCQIIKEQDSSESNEQDSSESNEQNSSESNEQDSTTSSSPQCPEGTVLSPSTNQCVVECTKGLGSNQCLSCDIQRPDKCGSCNPNSNLINGECQPLSESGCASSILHCVQCNTSNIYQCVKCEHLYGLRGGLCTYCGEGLFDDVYSPCKIACPQIENCEECVRENNELLCTSCIEGFHVGIDHKTCIADGVYDCTDKLGCLKCNETTDECIECDANGHFQLQEGSSSNRATCQCLPEYTLVENKCEKITEVPCSESQVNCTKCGQNENRCIECKFGFGLTNGKCVECEEGKYVSGTESCRPSCSSIQGCKSCSMENGNLVCDRCDDDGYIESPDKRSCINITASLYSCTDVFGCSQCLRGISGCYKCDEENHFTHSIKRDGTCVCDPEYDFFNNQCVLPPGPFTPPPTPPQTELPSELLNCPTGQNCTIYLNSEALDNNLVYTQNIPQEAPGIIVPETGPVLSLNIGDRNKPFIVDSKPKRKVTIVCPKTADLVVPKENKITVETDAPSLTISPTDNSDTVSIHKVTPSQDLTISQGTANVTLNELLVNTPLTFTGQEGGHQTTCSKVMIQRGIEFKPKRVVLGLVQIGLRSIVDIDDAEVVARDAIFEVFYNSTQDSNIPVPIHISEKVVDLSNAIIRMNQASRDAYFQETDLFTLAEFESDNVNKSMEKCNEVKYEKGGSDYGEASCEPDGKNNAKLVARKTTSNKPKDKGLSAGAIAGIVIACVVVAAAIIALLVYFLAIKKKANSTSTQGDSSIAI